MVVGGELIYLHSNYFYVNQYVKTINVEFIGSTPSESPVGYILDSTEVLMNFKIPLPVKKVNDSTIELKLSGETRVRQFRLYFNPTLDTLRIKSFTFNSGKVNLNLVDLRNEEINIITNNDTELSFNVLKKHGYTYVESPRFIYDKDFQFIVLAAILISVLINMIIHFLFNRNLQYQIKRVTLTDFSIFLVIVSVFISQKAFNISLIFSFILIIKNFDMRRLLNNKLNVFLIGFFLVVILNFFFINPDYNFRIVEKYAIFFILPIYVSCILDQKRIAYFCFAAFLIGTVLFSGAVTDVFIYRNFQITSFENFTRGIHPVYYSYLLSFCIIYIQLNRNWPHKGIYQLALLLLLLLSGSKLVMIITLIGYIILSRKLNSLIIVPLVLILLFSFKPVRDRFIEVLNTNDLTVITEKHINDPQDPRLNGLTLRVILWQESLSVDGVKDFLFGNGISSNGLKVYETRLRKRGLTNHDWYNAHNQYFTTFFKLGVIGLIVLLSLLGYSIWLGIVSRNSILIMFTLLISFAMCSESIFERSFGISFFCLIALLLTNREGEIQSK